MTILYNCRHSGDQYRITKFDSDMNPQGSYLVTRQECDCPAGPRPTCRHRNMLHDFLERQHVGDEWFLDFDRGGWVQMDQPKAKPEPHSTEASAPDFDSEDGGSNPPAVATHIPRRL